MGRLYATSDVPRQCIYLSWHSMHPCPLESGADLLLSEKPVNASQAALSSIRQTVKLFLFLLPRIKHAIANPWAKLILPALFHYRHLKNWFQTNSPLKPLEYMEKMCAKNDKNYFKNFLNAVYQGQEWRKHVIKNWEMWESFKFS